MTNLEISGKLPVGAVEILKKLYNKFNRVLKRKPASLCLSLINEQEMTKLNKRFFGRNKPTDVLSFEDGDEIIICLSVAKQQAKLDKKTINDELALLFVHGCLHIAGYDHNTEKNASKMADLQKKILGQIPNRKLEFIIKKNKAS